MPGGSITAPVPENSQSQKDRPELETILSSHDFESVAATTFSKKGWSFFSTAATDLITRDNNKAFFDRIWFRPRLMRDITSALLDTEMLGCRACLPMFIAPVGMARLAHPDGERALGIGAEAANIPLCLSTVAR